MKSRIYSIDFLRFLFAIGIVVLHVSGMRGFLHIAEFRQGVSNASVIVECFFILSGYFLQLSLTTKEVAFLSFLRDKIARLWPTMFVSLLIVYFMGGMSGSQLMMNSCFLQCVGYTVKFKGILWFISPLFWGLLFYYGLFYAIKEAKCRNLVISVVVYISYLLCMNGANGGFSRNFAYSFVPMSVCRALGGLGLGFLVSAFVSCFAGMKLKMGIGRGIGYTIMEIAAVFALFVNLFIKKWAAHPLFVIVILMVAVLTLFVLKIGYLSRILDNPKLAYPGRYAYSIYVMQPVGMSILEKFTADLRMQTTEGMLVVLYSIALVTLGILGYYIIELPGKVLVKRFFSAMSGENIQKAE